MTIRKYQPPKGEPKFANGKSVATHQREYLNPRGIFDDLLDSVFN
ncbi:hypothetical protein VIAG107301_21115 [Vibrio agarivorans]